MSSDRMMEYYYSMGQDCLTNGALDDAVTYFRKAAKTMRSKKTKKKQKKKQKKPPMRSAPSDARWKPVMG